MIDIYVILLFLVYMFIWLFCFFGGLFSIKFVKIITLLILPGIYLLHILPFHIFEKEKINNINKHIEYYINKHEKDIKKITNDDLYIYTGNFLQCIPKDISDENKNLIIKVYICEENKYILPKLLRNLRKIFKKSYFNPLSAQGMMILSYIINIYLLKFKYKIL